MLHFWKTEKKPQDFLDLLKNIPNQPQFLPSYFKIVFKRMATEQGLYSQVIMIRHKHLDNK